MTSRTAPNTEERLEIAKEPALLAQGAELNQDPNRATSLNVGSGANKAAVIIPKSLYKNSRAQNTRSNVLPEDPKRLYNRNQYRVSFDNVSTSRITRL
jgi:hypothetical protein